MYQVRTWSRSEWLAARSARIFQNRKGDKTFHYDFRNRLTEVLEGGVLLAAYRYDTFNRRVEKDFPAVPDIDYVWSGLREVEEYRDGILLQRRTYGLGLDEIAHMEINLDGSSDQSLEVEYFPVYDAAGNLVLFTGPGGKKVASSSGSSDATPPEIDSVHGDHDYAVASDEYSSSRWLGSAQPSDFCARPLGKHSPRQHNPDQKGHEYEQLGHGEGLVDRVNLHIPNY